MPKDDFFERFRALHEMDAKAPLTKVERAEYDAVKERFAEAICAAQRVQVKPGQTARSTFSVALLLRLKLTIDGAVQQTSTLGVSGGGFEAPLASVPPEGAREISFELFLTKTESITGRARIAHVRDNRRASFTFVDLKPASLERIERMLFDEMLQQLVRAAVRPG